MQDSPEITRLKAAYFAARTPRERRSIMEALRLQREKEALQAFRDAACLLVHENPR